MFYLAFQGDEVPKPSMYVYVVAPTSLRVHVQPSSSPSQQQSEYVLEKDRTYIVYTYLTDAASNKIHQSDVCMVWYGIV